MVDDLKSLCGDLLACRKCKLYSPFNKIVIGEGRPGAEVMLVGDSVDEEEARSGVPLSGAAGAILEKTLKECGIAKESVRITNVTHCLPPNGRKATAEELQICSEWLKREIEIVKPKLLVALGGTAMKVLLGLEGVNKYAGMTMDSKYGVPVYVCNNPRYVLHKASNIGVFRAQISKITEALSKGQNKSLKKTEGKAKATFAKETFTHLHLHDEYSFLDAVGTTEEFVAKAASLGHQAIAQTNHGNLMGAVKLTRLGQQYGIKTIIGLEVGLVEDASIREGAGSLIVLLAKNQKGYQNLVKLATAANVDGFYYKPRIDWKMLEQYHEGLIVGLGDLQGYFANTIFNMGDVKKDMARIRKLFADDMFLELQPTFSPGQKRINLAIQEWAKKLKIRHCVTVSVRYPNPEDGDTHEIIRRIERSNYFSPAKDLWYMTKTEILAGFAKNHLDLDQEFIDAGIENTNAVAAMIEQVKFSGKPMTEMIPSFGENSVELFKKIIHQGFIERGLDKLPANEFKIYRDRVKMEYDQCVEFGLVNYILIVWDVIKATRVAGMFPSPGRGSIGGLLIAYLLKITNVDPIELKLRVDRFISPDRFASQYSFSFEDYSLESWKHSPKSVAVAAA